jgi:phage protein D
MKVTMDKQTGDIDVNNLLIKYKSFFVPSFKVQIGVTNGASPDQELIKLKPPIVVFDLSVDRALNEAGSFSFTVDNPVSLVGNARYFPRLERDSPLQPGRNVVIGFGYDSNVVPVITGTIDSIDVAYESNGLSKLTVKGFDYIKPLMNDKRIPANLGGKENLITYSEIAKQIADKYNLTIDIEDSSQKFSNVQYKGDNDFDFIKKKLAEPLGYDVYVRDKILHFHRPRINKTFKVQNLVWGKSLINFSPRLELSQQVKSVEVRGWDPDTQTAVVGTATAGSESNRAQGQSGSEAAVAAGNVAAEKIWLPEKKTQEEVQKKATAILERHSEKFLTGSGECVGLPEIEPGMIMELKGLGQRFSTDYYITKVTQTMNSSGFKTQFTVSENTIPSRQKL